MHLAVKGTLACLAAFAIWKRYRQMSAALEALRVENAKLAKEMRMGKQDASRRKASLEVGAIGKVESVFSSRNYTPNQPTRVPSSRARIVLDVNLSGFRQGSIDGLEDFGYLWVIFHFHDNNNRSSKSKILPPRKPDNVKVGVFCCRSPNRPNPLGLSLVKLDRVDKVNGHLYISSVDLLDGTPVLDIKPYIPHHDQPLSSADVKVASWIAVSSSLTPDFETVEISPLVVKKLNAHENIGGVLYESVEDVLETLQQVLQWEGRKRHIRETGGQWLFDMLGFDFIMEYGINNVRCVDVFKKGEVKYVKGAGIVPNDQYRGSR
eukprot:CAMPEP_0203775900 /NCGR_PEP_ID=MMETSP0099_2-20121227/6402_1 /ASSEMBLY_ACC=CAM_ASM_000209 /TAXON_ID=96639 /ORGANISM=" , Strain NY0313808BC1" /LENGTH=320 /DNA_ID=CAMNT_0050674757 /DNA_START=1479 /DNA_END=2441 /DNA_ORIENTATION=-